MNIQEAEKLLNLTDEEKNRIIKHKLDFEQIKWMRYICRNKCGGNWDIFFQQYPLESEDAFLISGKCRFNVLSLKKMKVTTINEGERGNFVETHDKISWVPDPNGIWRMWKRPKRDMVCVCGSDVAEGSTIEGKVFGAKDSTDYSTGQILDAKKVEQVAELQCRYEPDVFSEELYRGCKYYSQYAEPLLGVERNMQGLAVLHPLREKYNNLFFMENFDQDTQIRKKKIGWLTGNNKYDIISVLDQYIREEKIIIHSPYLLSELMTFVRFADATVGGMQGCHDDLVMAMAIALRMIRYVTYEKKDGDASQEVINRVFDKVMGGGGEKRGGY